MFKVAVTGGMGSGKSAVLGMLAGKGCKVLDADSIVSSLYERKEVRQRVLRIFGSLDRKEIAGQAFPDSGKRAQLEALLHPLARKRVLEWFKGLKGERLAFVEVPLLFESGFEKDFDFVVVVTAGREERIRRLCKKGISREECEARMDVQMPEQERLKKAGFVIDNSGLLGDTRKQVRVLLKKLGGQKPGG